MSPLRWARLSYWITGNMTERLLTDDILRTSSGGLLVTLRVLSVEDFMRFPGRYLRDGPVPVEDDRDNSFVRRGRQLSITRIPDPRSDIYSLGTVIYYLLTGQPPFRGDKPLQVMIAHAHDDVLPPTQIRPEIPKDLELVALKCLAKRPADRYQSALELRAALADCEMAGRWTRAAATDWWRQFGCPEKRALDKAVLEAAGV